MKHMYDIDIKEEDFDFTKNSPSNYLPQESLIVEYVALFVCFILITLVYQHVQIDINLSFDNLFNTHGFIFKHKIY